MTPKAARSIQSVQWLPAERLGQMNVEPTRRALRDADVKPEGLWARRSRVALRGAPLLMQEVFLPGMGRS
jgi:chorismate-pyruvate lyase